ncbi:MAG: hypothetical protein IIT94_09040, partial [Prevotella sp.]|nr:hypothetical protein [Prevotella sp.]
GEDTLLCEDIVYGQGKRLVYDPWAIVYHHRRRLFGPHLRQLGRYAFHRGYFVKKSPKTSFKLSYFVPSLFVLGLVAGGAALGATEAGVIGVEVDKNPISVWDAGKSILLFRWYGVNKYQFALYDHSMTETERDEVMRLHQFILYNDSVVFESYGGYPGGRGFPDKETFQSQHHRISAYYP